ncbi:MAG: hydroxyacylglutathione hydrolase [Rhodobacteraceae bacterium HLUCCA08]|nr:MAG: hydroxyacylglutathione hydrolase [Rhodobacteraceae bacterium HLUCCA08]
MDDSPRPGRPEPLAPGLRRVLAPNPSPMTHWGTNTYLLGKAALAVIDPGPDDDAHLQALLEAIGTVPVSHILVTHSHKDHSPLAPRLAALTGAPVLAFGDSAAGRSPAMTALALSADLGGGEGVDAGFAPDRRLADGARLDGADWSLTARHTPGHFGNHMCFLWGDGAFSGDHVMGWASTLISPPDGDLGAFRRSCADLAATGVRRLWPGHGAPVDDAPARIAALLAHREARDAQIRAALAAAPGTAAELAARIYTDTPAALLPAAARNVLAHLIALRDKGFAAPRGPLSADAVFAPTGR